MVAIGLPEQLQVQIVGTKNVTVDEKVDKLFLQNFFLVNSSS